MTNTNSHLHFVQSLEPLQGGGLGTAALQLHSAMNGQGISSRLCATKDAGFIERWPHVEQCVRLGPTPLFYSYDLGDVAKKAVQQTNVVHSHGLYVYPNWLFGRLARKYKKPLVYHIHGIFDPWILRRSRFKKKLVGTLFENANLSYTSLFRALTSKEASQIRSLGFKQKVVVLPNGIDLDEIDHRPTDDEVKNIGTHLEKKRPKRLLFLSRIHPKKGLEMLVNVWGDLSPLFPDWELAIVGPDEGGYQRKIEERIQARGLSEVCKIHPSVFGPAKNAVYRSADLFVLPSFSEGFPMVILEALAHRVPVVMTTECNFPELADLDIAWECKPAEEALKESLSSALNHTTSELHQKAELGRDLVSKRYSWKAICSDLDTVCNDFA